MAHLEGTHWWYRGLRDVLQRSLIRHFQNRSPRSILDAGCGTGANLAFLSRLFPDCELEGFDASPQAVEHAKKKIPAATIALGDLCHPQTRQQEYDLIFSCDVINIPGFDRAEQGLRTLTQRLAPGGLMALHLPAYQWLKSEHDVAVHTRERYLASQVRSWLNDWGLSTLQITYRISLLFPLLVAKRLPSILFPPKEPSTARSDLRPPSPWVNEWLFRMVQLENVAIEHRFQLPFGSSIWALARKD